MNYFLVFYWASSSLLLPTCVSLFQLSVTVFYRGSAHRIGALHNAPHARLSKLVADTSTGAEYIHAFGWQKAFVNHFYDNLRDMHQWRLHRNYLSAWSRAFGKLIAAFAAIGVVFCALQSKEPVSHAAIGFAFMTLMHFGSQIRILAVSLVGSDVALDGAHVIRAFIQSTPQEQDPEDCADVPLDWPQRGRIQVNCVTAQYRSDLSGVRKQKAHTDKVQYENRPIGGTRHTALDHVSFTIEPGHIVGISGRTGRYIDASLEYNTFLLSNTH